MGQAPIFVIPARVEGVNPGPRSEGETAQRKRLRFFVSWVPGLAAPPRNDDGGGL